MSDEPSETQPAGDATRSAGPASAAGDTLPTEPASAAGDTLPTEPASAAGDTLPTEPGTSGGPPGGRRALEILHRLASGADGRYQHRGELGRGATGDVLARHDEVLRRTVAMKVLRLRPAEADDSVQTQQVARFVEEAQITGQLDHPGVVPVYDLGLDADGRPWFTMARVRGEEFRAVIEHVHAGRGDWTRARALGVVQRVCEAMAYAHSKGVVHRDLKPSNVMVGTFGEVYVMDWGIARVEGAESAAPDAGEPESVSVVLTDREELRQASHESSLLTGYGAVMGTPAYMAPEQARGEHELVGPWSDVYAVGAMLYHLLTGRVPYVRPGERLTARDLVARVQLGPPETIESLADDVPVALVAIAEKAMAREIPVRYAHMGELQRDLAAYLEGRVVRAHRTGAVAEFGSWVRRNRGMAASLAALLLVIVGGSVGLAWVQSEAAAREKRLADDLAVETAAAVRARDAEVDARRLADEQRQDAERARADAEAQQQLALEARDEAERQRLDAVAARDQAEVERQRAEREARRAAEQAVEADRQRVQAERVAALMENLFDAARPGETGDGGDVSVRSVLDQAAREVTALPDDDAVVKGRLLITLGAAYQSLAQFDRADALSSAAVELTRVRLGEDHPDSLRAQVERAELLLSRGAESEALADVLDAVRRCREVLGDDHPVTMTAVHMAGVVHTRMGHWAEAQELLEDAVALRRERYGRWDRHSLAVLMELGNVHVHRGRPDLAEPLLREGLEVARVIHGPMHAVVLNASNSLAAVAHARGDLEEARRQFEACREVAERIYDPGHPRRLSVANNLGAVLLGLGRLDEAAALLDEVLAQRRAVLGEAHPETLQSINNLAALRFHMGDVEEATRLYRGALAAMQLALGERHPETLNVLQSLVTILAQQREWSEAAALCEQLVERTAEGDGRLPERLQLLENFRRQLEWLEQQPPESTP